MSGAKRVLLGLSGGVDSAVSAALLLEAGYEVQGHFLDIGLGGEEDARLIATRLDIPFSVGTVREDLERFVCAPFAADYLAGRTPIPCARCNPTVKFPALIRAAAVCKADFVATGHYARIMTDERGEAFLHRGEPDNDQSYMLARLPKDWLSRLRFPLGDFAKTEVRALAHRFDIPVADKPDSMEICFIPDGDYAAWIERRGQTPPPGQFVDQNGAVLGQHKGIHHYTMGQRRGLGVSAAQRLFVSALRPETNEVVLSDGEDLFAKEVYCHDLNFLAPLEDGQRIALRIRHSKTEYPALFWRTDAGAILQLETEARAPTPGQLAVFYENGRVLGSGWIVE